MRKFYTILFFFIGCTAVGDHDRRESPAPIDLNAEIAPLRARVTKLEPGSVYQVRQIALLVKLVTPHTGKLIFLTTRFIADDVKKRGEIKLLAGRFHSEGIRQWIVLKSASILIPKVESLRVDSIAQWAAIKKLPGTSPVTQIPVIQSQIRTIQLKDLNRDKNFTALQSQVSTAGIKNDSPGNLIMKYATKFNLTQYTLTAGVVSIPALVTLQTRITDPEALQPPGQL